MLYCEKWVRINRVSSLPYGLYTIDDKIKIFNSYIVRVGNVAIIETGLVAGHVAFVKLVSSDQITIEEANFPSPGIRERTDIESNLKIVEYFDPNVSNIISSITRPTTPDGEHKSANNSFLDFLANFFNDVSDAISIVFASAINWITGSNNTDQYHFLCT